MKPLRLSVPLLSVASSAALLLAMLGAPTAASGQSKSGPVPGLDDLNQSFRALYQERTRQVLHEHPLVLVVQNSAITAVRGTRHTPYPVDLTHYDQIKSISHAVLGFHGLMQQLAHAGPTTDWRQVQRFQQRLKALQTHIGQSVLDPTEKQQAGLLLNALTKAVQDALDSGSITAPEIRHTLQSIRPEIDALSMSAGQRHVRVMSGVLDRIRKDASPKEWSEAVAVVTGPMTPRRNNLETAIVASAMGKDQLGRRIFYTENIFTVEGALSWLQTVLGDRELAENVFDDPYRMWQDLFAPVSRTLIETDFYTELPSRP